MVWGFVLSFNDHHWIILPDESHPCSYYLQFHQLLEKGAIEGD
jgi:hypothetical protein